MIYRKRPAEIGGLWCRKNKTFYFLETGVHTVRNPLDRIRSSLTLRGLVPVSNTNILLHEEPLIRMTMAEATEKDYKTDCIYLNQHVREQVEAEKNGTDDQRKNPWSS